MYMNDPNILNKDVDANQPDFFDETISGNMPLKESSIEVIKEEKAIDEDDRFFGTRVIEAKETLKKLFKK